MSKPRDMKKVSQEAKRKRARNGSGHVRLRSDGRWEGQYYLNGERKSCYGETEENCIGELKVILGKIYLGTYVDGSQMPLYSYLHKWHYDYQEIRPSTHVNYDTYIEGHLFNSRLGSIPLKKLRLDDFVTFFKKKEVTGRLDNKPGGLGPKTLRNIRNMLSEALEFAINNLHWLSHCLLYTSICVRWLVQREGYSQHGCYLHLYRDQRCVLDCSLQSSAGG